jgi:hypothetical protein
MPHSKESIPQILSRVNLALAGVEKNLSTMPSITLGGVVFTPAALVASFSAYAPLVTALAAAHAQLRALVVAQHTMRAEVLATLDALEAFVQNLYGPDPNKLGDFGFSPRKARVESAEMRALAQAKGKATRAAKKAALAAIAGPKGD